MFKLYFQHYIHASKTLKAYQKRENCNKLSLRKVYIEEASQYENGRERNETTSDTQEIKEETLHENNLYPEVIYNVTSEADYSEETQAVSES